MRLCKPFLALVLALQAMTSVANAQLSDGQCVVPLDASQFQDLVTTAGVQAWVDFAISAPFMTSSPVADGVISTNEYANQCYFTFSENANPGHSWPNLDNLEDGDADLTANMYFAHTNEALFVAFQVFDDYLDLDFPANSFQNDGVEIFINPDIDGGDDWGPGKFQVYADAAGDGEIEFNNRGVTGGGPAPNALGDPVDGEWYSAGLANLDNNSYVVEFQIPLGSLDTAGGLEDEPVPARTGDVLLINTAIDDNDENDDPTQQTGHHIMWHFDGAGSPWGGGEAIWPVPLLLAPEATGGDPGDFDGNGSLDGADIDALTAAAAAGTNDAKYDLNDDNLVNDADVNLWAKELKKTWIGDADLNGEFNSGDFVEVFTKGKYESGSAAVWTDGDWNGDGQFNSGDFVAAFTDGGYELGPRAATAAVPEPSTLVLALTGILMLVRRRR